MASATDSASWTVPAKPDRGSGSPASGSAHIHELEQRRLMEAAFADLG